MVGCNNIGLPALGAKVTALDGKGVGEAVTGERVDDDDGTGVGLPSWYVGDGVGDSVRPMEGEWLG